MVRLPSAADIAPGFEFTAFELAEPDWFPDR
jgi:predicted cupin superfamily sugar epimerase